ncbi:MAG: hypothetical protein NC347_01615 [Clostridium sp.]|nr:hypothetical protein [Clostridium sp.]
MELDEMLKTAYRKESVPEDVNIRLKNQFACKEAMEDKSISFWWLPAMLSTILAVAGFAASVLAYLLIQMKSADYIMPNLVHLISTGFLHIELAAAVCQIGISWIFTAIGLWKLNFHKRAHIL